LERKIKHFIIKFNITWGNITMEREKGIRRGNSLKERGEKGRIGK